MGDVTVTVKNLKIVEVRPEQNLLFVRGAVPGGENALVLITKG
jgi:large subunit ribosomal protein L3